MDAFSRDEVEFLKQAGLFAWKERLTQRIKNGLETLHDALAARLTPDVLLAPDGMDWTRWQVVRGERFDERPYAYLDFPQYFSRETKFTYRSMFWWGEGLFFAIILEGNLLDRYRANLETSYSAVADRDLALSLSETPWEWHVAGPRVLPIRAETGDAVISAMRRRTFLKLQRAVSLDRLAEPDAIVRESLRTFEDLMPVVTRTGS
jgi:hypothetical protein